MGSRIPSCLALVFSLVVATIAAAAPYAYVAQVDSNSIAVIDLASQSVVATIPVGKTPIAVEADAAGARVYVANAESSSVSVIDTATRSVAGTIPLADSPGLIAVNPAGTRLAVTYPGSETAPGNKVGLYDTATRSLVGTATAGSGPLSVAFNPGGTRFYVANALGNTVSVVDAASLTTIATVPVSKPFFVAVNPAGTRLYVASPDAVPNFTIVDLATHTVIASLNLGGTATQIAMNPAGTRIYVGNDDGFVSVIDTATNTLAGTIPTGGHPISVGVTPDGSRVVAIDGDVGWLRAYDASTFAQVVNMTTAKHVVAWGRFIVASSGPDAPYSPGPRSGLWWNPNESGWGIHFTQRGNVIFAAWYTYDANGAPKWYVASRCVVAGSGCSGFLYQVTGPRFFGVPFDPSAANVTSAGTLDVTFTSNDAGTMTYAVGGQARTVPISRQVFRSSGASPAIDYTDLWWNSSESGWGMAVTQQFGTMFLAWFVYDGGGQPVWYVASDCAVTAGGNGCSGTLYRTMGPPFGPSFDTSQVVPVAVGSVTLAFGDANHGTLTYTVDGVSGSKAITRQLF